MRDDPAGAFGGALRRRVAVEELPGEPLALGIAVGDGDDAQTARPARSTVSDDQSATRGTALRTTARSVVSQSIDSAIRRPASARSAMRAWARAASCALLLRLLASVVRAHLGGLGVGAGDQRLTQQPRLLDAPAAAAP